MNHLQPKKDETLSIRTDAPIQPHHHDTKSSESRQPKVVELTPPVEQKYIEFDTFDPHKCPKDFFMLIGAPRRHGKTTVMLHLLREWHKVKRFTHVMLWSKTLSGYEEYIPGNYQFTSLDNMKMVLDRQMAVGKYNKHCEEKKKHIKSSILLILDDMASEQHELRSGDTAKLMLQLAVNGRHVCRRDPCECNECCVVVITQRLTLIPPAVRCNSDIVICSRLCNRTERERICMESLTLHSGRDGMKEAYGVLDTVTLSKPYRFLVVCMFMANRMKHSDYIFYLDADDKADPVKLFGSKDDWKRQLQDIEFG